MDEEKEKPLYTLPVDYLKEILDNAEEQVGTSEDLLQELLQNPPKNSNLISMLVEILWSNFAILRLMDEEIETAVLHKNEETGEDEFICLQATMAQLQQVMLARHYANLALNNLSYSVSIH